METTNSSENQQRRVEDRKPNETINWEAPGAPAVPLSLAAFERPNPPIRYVASLLVNSEGASVFTTPDAARLPHGHYLLSAGAHSIGPGPAATSGDAPTDLHAAILSLPCEADPALGSIAVHSYKRGHAEAREAAANLVARIERAAAPAPSDGLNAADYEEVLADHRRLVRKLDVLLNGEHGAAKQASLCDIVSQVERERTTQLADSVEWIDLLSAYAANPTLETASAVTLFAERRAAAPATASGDELPLSQITDTTSARKFVDAWHRKHFPTDRTFSRYIMADPARSNPLAGDFAWQLAKALEAMEARAAVSAATKPVQSAEHANKDVEWLMQCAEEAQAHPEVASKIRTAARAAATNTAAEPVATEGFVLAPTKTTPEMRNAGLQEAERRDCDADRSDVEMTYTAMLAAAPAASTPAAPSATEGFVLMPKRLTAENGAKAAMIGEFYEEITVRCPDCADCDEGQYCSGCNDEGTVQQPVQVQWDTIKQIYTRAVELLAATPAASTTGAAQTAGRALEDAEEAAEILDNFITNVSTDGPYSAEATLTFISQAKHCVDGVVRALKDGAAQTAEQVREPERREVWSNNNEDFNFDTLGDLLDDGEYKPGDTVWVGDAVKPDLSELIDADDVADQMADRADDIAGEHADGYPDLSKDDKRELDALLSGWIARRCPPNFYRVENVKPYVLSADDFPSPTHSSEAGDA